MEIEKRKTIKDLSLEFSVQLVDLATKLSTKKSVLNINQLVRSGTAIGAMVREAQGAESRRDFIHKMKIAFKEAEETEYWLLLIGRKNALKEIEALKDQILQIQKMLSKIISTSIANDKKPQ